MQAAVIVPVGERSLRERPRSVLVNQAAELLGVSRRTVYNRIREGRLRTIRTRCGSQRVLVDSVESLLREMRRKARERAITLRKPRERAITRGAGV